MHIVIRVDAGGEFGLGHWRRMQAVTQELRDQDPESYIYFATRTPDVLRPGLHDQDDLIVLEEESENQALLRLATEHAGGALIIDTPSRHDPDVLQYLRGQVRVIRIDHPWAEANTADLMVTPNMHQQPDTVAHLEEAFGDRWLYGAESIIVPSNLKPRFPTEKREPHLVVFAGGVDPDGILKRFYEMTRELTNLTPDMHRIFLLGRMAEPFTITQADSRAYVTGYHHTHLQEASLAIGPLSTMTYECIYYGTPVLTFGRTPDDALCSEQLSFATGGASFDLGYLAELMQEDICGAIEWLWNNEAEQKNMFQASENLIDGNGAKRIANHILALERHASTAD